MRGKILIQSLLRTRLRTAVVGAIVATGLLAAGASRAGIFDFLDHKSAPTQITANEVAPQYSSTPAPAIGPTQAPNYREIVKRWGPAVVGITVEGTRKASFNDPDSGEMNNDPFFQFFQGLPGFQFHGVPRNFEQPFKGEGSGFIITSDGMILTNAHVVRDAREVTVKLADRRELSAKVLGADPVADIAVVKVNATGLPTVRFGDPKALQVGDYVLAIGAPFGFDQSATAGIVSAKGRSLPGDAYVPYIQTDAAVNPGNSGGPLFDAGGNVVGINAQIYTQTGGYQGLAFAVPIDVALHAKDQIVATGHASHARLGVMVQDLNQGLADSFGLPRPDGALVAEVDAGSPAESAGLKSGDVITQIDGTPIERGGDLSNRIGMDVPGTRVDLKVWRNHAVKDISVKLAEAQPNSAHQASSDGDEHGRLGLVLRPLTRDEREQGGVDHGLLVEDVSGVARRAGVQPGDVLLGINGEPARSVDQVKSVVSGHPKSVALLIERDGQKIFVPVQLG